MTIYFDAKYNGVDLDPDMLPVGAVRRYGLTTGLFGRIKVYRVRGNGNPMVGMIASYPNAAAFLLDFGDIKNKSTER